jgi:hypothetical protein
MQEWFFIQPRACVFTRPAVVTTPWFKHKYRVRHACACGQGCSHDFRLELCGAHKTRNKVFWEIKTKYLIIRGAARKRLSKSCEVKEIRPLKGSFSSGVLAQLGRRRGYDSTWCKRPSYFTWRVFFQKLHCGCTWVFCFLCWLAALARSRVHNMKSPAQINGVHGFFNTWVAHYSVWAPLESRPDILTQERQREMARTFILLILHGTNDEIYVCIYSLSDTSHFSVVSSIKEAM